MGERTSDAGVVEREDGAEAGEAESGDQDGAEWAALILMHELWRHGIMHGINV